jgi:hypothetical protein
VKRTPWILAITILLLGWRPSARAADENGRVLWMFDTGG